MNELSPAAAFINDINRAFGLGQSRGLSVKKMARLAKDFANDLKDIAKEDAAVGFITANEGE